MSDNHGADLGINAIIYGGPKIGKSTLADTVPKPSLILDAEGGSRFTPSRKTRWDPTTGAPPPVDDGTWDATIVAARTYKAVQQAFQWLNSGKHPFRSVVLDSISEIQQRAVDDIAGRNQMTTPDWGNLLRMLAELIRDFRDLNTHPTNPLDAVIFIGMAKMKNDVCVPDLQGQIGDKFPYLVDACMYYAPVVNPETGEEVRRLFIRPMTGFVTGNRWGDALGAKIDGPDIAAMVRRIREAVASGELSTAPAERPTADETPSE